MSFEQLEQELERLLVGDGIQTLFQPIVDVRELLVEGYEALSRGPSDSPLHPASMLFETAERCGRTLELENQCLSATRANWTSTRKTQKLFVNVSPDNLLPGAGNQRLLESLLEGDLIQPGRVVIELSERYPAIDLDELKRSLTWLKSRGFQVALDDLGAGYSGLKLWSEVEPDYVKIDRHFIRDIHEDLVKREFVRSVMQLSSRLNCKVVAEGVERHRELELLQDLGVRYIQGFLFGRPRSVATATLEPLSQVSKHPAKGVVSAASLVHHPPTLDPDQPLEEAWAMLQAQNGVFALPVIDPQGRALGLLHKWQILEAFGSTFGRSLNEKKPIRRVMKSDALVFEHNQPLEELSRRLTEDEDDYLRQHFLVTRDGFYEGMGATRALLKRMTEHRIEKARYANPLTLLPGNVPIHQEIESRLSVETSFLMIYFDINAFKPLNDHLGFSVGDRLIVLLGRLLERYFCRQDDMIGHLGGDDFIVFCNSANHAVYSCTEVITRFNDECQSVYREQDRRRGCVKAQDRNGRSQTWPLATLAAGIIRVHPGETQDTEDVVQRAAAAKKQVKAESWPEYEQLLTRVS
ncbi:GGDEF domain-containing protein [Salicola sp. Rm-C-2C1-2]|uniref:GGDEF domain-containing protein n=1 Tax=Salicola sp. Rm-C-2C1-2 TaxID=3141321 RepID=UPI0032E4370D